MNQEQKQLKIAEACGWTNVKILQGENRLVLTGEHHGDWFSEFVPDYFRDLDACHEMEKSLAGINQTLQYQDKLESIMKTWDARPFVMFAPAWVRAESFGQTLGLWEEEE
jgi:hypothetical protein